MVVKEGNKKLHEVSSSGQRFVLSQ